VKGRNVLINDNGIPQLCDFGRSEIVGYRGYPTAFAASFRYVAPELMKSSTTQTDNLSGIWNDASVTNDEYFDPHVTKQTDVYSFGLTSLEVSRQTSNNK